MTFTKHRLAATRQRQALSSVQLIDGCPLLLADQKMNNSEENWKKNCPTLMEIMMSAGLAVGGHCPSCHVLVSKLAVQSFSCK